MLCHMHIQCRDQGRVPWVCIHWRESGKIRVSPRCVPMAHHPSLCNVCPYGARSVSLQSRLQQTLQPPPASRSKVATAVSSMHIPMAQDLNVLQFMYLWHQIKVAPIYTLRRLYKICRRVAPKQTPKQTLQSLQYIHCKRFESLQCRLYKICRAVSPKQTLQSLQSRHCTRCASLQCTFYHSRRRVSPLQTLHKIQVDRKKHPPGGFLGFSIYFHGQEPV